jgi:hypothetical protein
MNINLLNIKLIPCYVDISYWNFVKITSYDYTVLPIYLLIILIISYFHKSRNIEAGPFYKYYIPGLFIKIFSGLIFCLIYMFYYTGDSLDYFNSSVAIANLLEKNSSYFFSILFNGPRPEYFSYFDLNTGWPETHMWRDEKAFFTIRIFTLFVIPAFKSYLITTTLVAWAAFSGVWRLYKVFCDLYPHLYKRFSIAFLFFPSVVFWGSGIMKDTITFSAAAWFTYSFYMVMFRKKKVVVNIMFLIITSWLLIKIKPYIFVSLLPGSLIWISFKRIKTIKNKVVRFLVTPVILSLTLVFGIIFINLFSSNLGAYSSFDSMIQKAQVTQMDLKRERQYGHNYYDIGEFDGTVSSLVYKAPIAIVSGLFRPFLWEISGPFGIVSAIESSILLFLVLLSFFRLGIINNFKFIFNTPIVFFSFLFCTIFAFSVGLATANFGALVRYRIPLLPFFLASQFIMIDLYKKQKQEKSVLEND